MVHTNNHFGWVVAACAAIVAQASQPAFCRACDEPCCVAVTARLAAAPAAPDQAGGCPLCAGSSRADRLESSDQPCHCQLDARHEQPLALSRVAHDRPADDGPAATITTTLPHLPDSIGVSREYVAASRALPIRPARIVFGVWRN